MKMGFRRGFLDWPTSLLELLLNFIKLSIGGRAELVESVNGHDILDEVGNGHSHNEPVSRVPIIEESHYMGVRILTVAWVSAIHHVCPENVVGSGDLLIICEVWNV